MKHVMIRCRARMPPGGEIERWLVDQVHDLDARAQPGTVRLSRLTEKASDADQHTGWLIELELAGDSAAPAEARVAETLRDMRLLGLEPTVHVRSEIPSSP